VAERFEKRHDHVLRDIDQILGAPNLGHGWFREVQSEHPTIVGRFDRSFDLTRQGFTLLVMGWTGERAMAFKVRYIEAFDAMEWALNNHGPITGGDLIQAVREIVSPLAVRFEGQDKTIERIGQRQDAMAEDIASIKSTLRKGRKNVPQSVRMNIGMQQRRSMVAAVRADADWS
jgi:Rha family phage regulatory protein